MSWINPACLDISGLPVFVCFTLYAASFVFFIRFESIQYVCTLVVYPHYFVSPCILFCILHLSWINPVRLYIGVAYPCSFVSPYTLPLLYSSSDLNQSSMSVSWHPPVIHLVISVSLSDFPSCHVRQHLPPQHTSYMSEWTVPYTLPSKLILVRDLVSLESPFYLCSH